MATPEEASSSTPAAADEPTPSNGEPSDSKKSKTKKSPKPKKTKKTEGTAEDAPKSPKAGKKKKKDLEGGDTEKPKKKKETEDLESKETKTSAAETTDATPTSEEGADGAIGEMSLKDVPDKPKSKKKKSKTNGGDDVSVKSGKSLKKSKAKSKRKKAEEAAGAGADETPVSPKPKSKKKDKIPGSISTGEDTKGDEKTAKKKKKKKTKMGESAHSVDTLESTDLAVEPEGEGVTAETPAPAEEKSETGPVVEGEKPIMNAKTPAEENSTEEAKLAEPAVESKAPEAESSQAKEVVPLPPECASVGETPADVDEAKPVQILEPFPTEESPPEPAASASTSTEETAPTDPVPAAEATPAAPVTEANAAEVPSEADPTKPGEVSAESLSTPVTPAEPVAETAATDYEPTTAEPTSEATAGLATEKATGNEKPTEDTGKSEIAVAPLGGPDDEISPAEPTLDEGPDDEVTPEAPRVPSAEPASNETPTTTTSVSETPIEIPTAVVKEAQPVDVSTQEAGGPATPVASVEPHTEMKSVEIAVTPVVETPAPEKEVEAAPSVGEGAATAPTKVVPVPEGATEEVAEAAPVSGESAEMAPAPVVPTPEGATEEVAEAVPVTGESAETAASAVVPAPEGATEEVAEAAPVLEVSAETASSSEVAESPSALEGTADVVAVAVAAPSPTSKEAKEEVMEVPAVDAPEETAPVEGTAGGGEALTESAAPQATEATKEIATSATVAETKPEPEPFKGEANKEVESPPVSEAVAGEKTKDVPDMASPEDTEGSSTTIVPSVESTDVKPTASADTDLVVPDFNEEEAELKILLASMKSASKTDDESVQVMLKAETAIFALFTSLENKLKEKAKESLSYKAKNESLESEIEGQLADWDVLEVKMGQAEGEIRKLIAENQQLQTELSAVIQPNVTDEAKKPVEETFDFGALNENLKKFAEEIAEAKTVLEERLPM